MPYVDQPLDDELLDLQAETQELVLAVTDPMIRARLLSLADDVLELGRGDAWTHLRS